MELIQQKQLLENVLNTFIPKYEKLMTTKFEDEFIQEWKYFYSWILKRFYTEQNKKIIPPDVQIGRTAEIAAEEVLYAQRMVIVWLAQILRVHKNEIKNKIIKYCSDHNMRYPLSLLKAIEEKFDDIMLKTVENKEEKTNEAQEMSEPTKILTEQMKLIKKSIKEAIKDLIKPLKSFYLTHNDILEITQQSPIQCLKHVIEKRIFSKDDKLKENMNEIISTLISKKRLFRRFLNEGIMFVPFFYCCYCKEKSEHLVDLYNLNKDPSWINYCFIILPDKLNLIYELSKQYVLHHEYSDLEKDKKKFIDDASILALLSVDAKREADTKMDVIESVVEKIRTDYYSNGKITPGYTINEILGFEDIYLNPNNYERSGGSRGMEDVEGSVARQ